VNEITPASLGHPLSVFNEKLYYQSIASTYRFFLITVVGCGSVSSRVLYRQPIASLYYFNCVFDVLPVTYTNMMTAPRQSVCRVPMCVDYRGTRLYPSYPVYMLCLVT